MNRLVLLVHHGQINKLVFIRLFIILSFLKVIYIFSADDKSYTPKWNSIDNKVNRVSYHGSYEIRDGFPLNIFGRTGIIGRGLLGRYGPNHAG